MANRIRWGVRADQWGAPAREMGPFRPLASVGNGRQSGYNATFAQKEKGHSHEACWF